MSSGGYRTIHRFAIEQAAEKQAQRISMNADAQDGFLKGVRWTIEKLLGHLEPNYGSSPPITDKNVLRLLRELDLKSVREFCKVAIGVEEETDRGGGRVDG